MNDVLAPATALVPATRPLGRHAVASGFDIACGVATLLLIASILPAFIGGQPVGPPAALVGAIQEQGDSIRQLVLLGLYGLHLVLLGWLLRPWAIRFLGWPLMLFLGWALLSMLWSPMPDPTLRRTVALSGTMAAGLFLGLRLGPAGLAEAFRISAAIVLVGSALHAIVFPALAFDHDGHLRGLFSHKNLLGSFLALAVLALIFRMTGTPAGGWSRMLDGGLLAACLGALLFAHSATPLLGMMMALGTYATVSLIAAGHSLPRAMLPALLGCGCALLTNSGVSLSTGVAEMLGRDPSFSGRTTVWSFVADAIAEHPWTGYGFGIFWLGEAAPGGVFWFWSRQYELHAHNGYLQLLLDAGIVGMALFLCGLLVLVQRMIILLRSGDDPERLVPCAALLLGFFLACNISESRILQGNDLLTLLFVWTAVRAHQEVWRRLMAARMARQAVLLLKAT
ncbi:O-antigen ligase family protein [Pseudoroseomonas globiformis]|uniref:O-antigen ligase family protein n=1 Tax=Teichococcus globiformis TaxID=2307229 RepID=A0ABV7FXW6_9PROT